MNSSLEKQVKNLTDHDFKYLAKNLVLKTYPCEYMNSFKRFNEKKLLDKESFYRSTKEGETDDNGEKLDSHINYEELLTWKKHLRRIWHEKHG